jgi:hypothetical protein
MTRFTIILGLCLALILQGCASYEPRVAPLKLPEAYANVQRVAGAFVGARAWDQEEEARDAFGFNIIRAGILPVQVSFDNRGEQTLVIEPTQTFLINQKQELFPVLSDQEAYDRVSRGGKLKEGVAGLTKGAILGGATGALIGAAIGVAAGGSVGDYAMRGAATGAATGAILGAGAAAGDTEAARIIADDLARHSLKNTPIKPGELAYGIILFPQESGRPQALRLQLQEKDTGLTQTLLLVF